MNFRFRPLLFALLLAVLPGGVAVAAFADGAPPVKVGAFVRVSLNRPAHVPWRMHISSYYGYGTEKGFFAGQKSAEKSEDAAMIPADQSSPWIDLGPIIPNGMPTVRFVFEPTPAEGSGGVEAKFEFASAPDDGAIVSVVSDHDDGDLISARVPATMVKDKQEARTINQDTYRRLQEVKALKLPDGPLPRKIWTMTGFRSNGEFYTYPEIAKMDFDTIKILGMNGFWEQNGGQPGNLRAMAHERGMDRSTVYWRGVSAPPYDAGVQGVRLRREELDSSIEKSYRETAEGTRTLYPDGAPELIVDLADEPAGIHFAGPEYQEAFRAYLQEQGLAPAFFGKKQWEEVVAPPTGWEQFFKVRASLDLSAAPNRRLFLWATKFWNQETARLYARATQTTLESAARDGFKVAGTRVNFGPPWVYDYGTQARGIDAFEFFRQNSVTLGFNEDWTGHGSPRTPLEINTLLADWSRAAARPRTPLLGTYITRDADRNTVKLRTFGALARETKIFDFYYYGPAYTFFDHWSDNASMVQGVGELTRDLGAVDDLLWAGRAPKAQVALLYSSSWPVWKTDDSEQDEQTMTYLALLHAGIPVDIVSDREVADGSFAARGYKALYVVNESVPSDAATAIQKWVKSGGHLWVEGWAGMKDEYNTPTGAWNDLLGVRARSWTATGDLKRLGQPIDPFDWQRPAFGREVDLTGSKKADAKPLAFTHGGMTAYARNYGRGIVQVVPWSAGREYMKGATQSERALGHAVLFPTDERRRVFAEFALSFGAQPPATTSENGIMAWPLWSAGGGTILLANFTGAPSKQLTVTFATTQRVNALRSLKLGALPFTRPDAEHIEVSLPMTDVTDILVAE